MSADGRPEGTMRLLIATDVFPPICGGSGWSAYELASGLRAHGHEVKIVRPRFGEKPKGDPGEFDGFRPTEFHALAPTVPFLRNLARNEWFYPRFAHWIQTVIREHRIELVHAQHLLTAPAGVMAARAEGVPVVCTIRDYWPLCYWTNLMLNPSVGEVCSGCTPHRMTHCIRPRGGVLWPLALPFVPYMRSNLERKRRALAGADTVVAVSSAVERTLRERAGELMETPIVTIPNGIDATWVRAEVEQRVSSRSEPYMLFAGKLEANKGASQLLPATASIDLQLIVVGDGSERSRLEAEARSRGRYVRFVGWLPRAELMALMRDAAFMIFPSSWPEPLPRVLIEASALGCPIVAMQTGGVDDVVVHGETGLLARTLDELQAHVRRMRRDPALAARLGAAARRRVDAVFDAEVVAEQHEELYASLIERRARAETHP